MTYQEAIHTINSYLAFGIKPGLERIQMLLEQLGNPQETLSCIHVAGTNGKGSTCAMLASILQCGGYKTGLFTSPYITEFRERMQVDGCMIPEDTLTRLLESILPKVEALKAQGQMITEFELITALAFCYFAEEKCDVVVLETGLGGRFDATNVIQKPLACVITPISLDHTAILGDTVEQIASEKAGILKERCPVVVASGQPEQALKVIEEQAQLKHCRLLVAEKSMVQAVAGNLNGTYFSYQDTEFHLPLLGKHQVQNVITVLTLLKVLRLEGFVLSDRAVQSGLSRVVWPARLEKLCDAPVVLLDGAHNPSGAQALAHAMEEYLKPKRIVGIMGMLRDKDCDSALQILASYFSTLYTLDVPNPRTLSAQEFAQKAAEHGVCAHPCASMEQAIGLALQEAGADGAVVVCGSLYLAGAIRPLLQRLQNPAD